MGTVRIQEFTGSVEAVRGASAGGPAAGEPVAQEVAPRAGFNPFLRAEKAHTTFKVPPTIGMAARLAAHLEGVTVSRFCERAVVNALRVRGIRGDRLPPPPGKEGRNPQPWEAVKAGILAVKPTRRDAFPVTMDAGTLENARLAAAREGQTLGDWAALALSAEIRVTGHRFPVLFLGSGGDVAVARRWTERE